MFQVCFRIACFLGDAAGATAALLLQNSIESIKSAITSETLPVFAVETGDEILNAHADDSSRQAALFALACYHKKGTAAMRAGLHHNNTSDVKTAILANRVPKSPPEAATHLLSSVAKDESRQLLAMMFLCNQGELLPLVTGLLRLASVEATYTLIGDLQSRMPPWMEEAEAVIVAAIGGCDGESAAAVAFLLAYVRSISYFVTQLLICLTLVVGTITTLSLLLPCTWVNQNSRKNRETQTQLVFF